MVPLLLPIDHNGTPVAAVPDAVIDQIAEDALEPKLAAFHGNGPVRRLVQAIDQGDPVVAQFPCQFLQDRTDHIPLQVQDLLFWVAVGYALVHKFFGKKD